MNKIMNIILKDNRSKLSVITGALSLLTFVFFVIMWQTTRAETSEMPMIVIIFSLVTAIGSVAATYKNWFHAVNLVAFISSVITFFIMIAGRVSYLAFYFSGDAMATGLSPMLVVALIFALFTVISAALAIFFEKSAE